MTTSHQSYQGRLELAIRLSGSSNSLTRPARISSFADDELVAEAASQGGFMRQTSASFPVTTSFQDRGALKSPLKVVSRLAQISWSCFFLGMIHRIASPLFLFIVVLILVFEIRLWKIVKLPQNLRHFSVRNRCVSLMFSEIVSISFISIASWKKYVASTSIQTMLTSLDQVSNRTETKLCLFSLSVCPFPSSSIWVSNGGNRNRIRKARRPLKRTNSLNDIRHLARQKAN